MSIDRSLSDAINDFAAKIDNTYSRNALFFSKCLHICREIDRQHKADNPDEGKLYAVLTDADAEEATRLMLNSAIAAYNEERLNDSLKILLDMVDQWLPQLVKSKSFYFIVGLVDILKRTIDSRGIDTSLCESDIIRLDLICAAHDMTAFSSSIGETAASLQRRSIDSLRRSGLIAHQVGERLPQINWKKTPADTAFDRVNVAKRLLSAYSLASDQMEQATLKTSEPDMWTGFISGYLQEAVSVVEAGDPQVLADYLYNYGSEFSLISALSTWSDSYVPVPDYDLTALSYFDAMVRLAEFLGVVPVEDIANLRNGGNLYLPVDEVVSRIEKALEISIEPPSGIVPTFGFASAQGIYHHRHINALYAAARVSQLNPMKKPVAEYGAGLGISAMYATRLGVTNYTIYDLPITCLFAGHYLILAMGAENVCLYGEDRKDNAIKLYPFWESANAEENEFYLTVNQDSFPEISEKLTRQYLTEISRFTSNYFLSINHESVAPRAVNDMVRDYPEYQKLYRQQYWIRPAYVEELYSLI